MLARYRETVPDFSHCRSIDVRYSRATLSPTRSPRRYYQTSGHLYHSQICPSKSATNTNAYTKVQLKAMSNSSGRCVPSVGRVLNRQLWWVGTWGLSLNLAVMVVQAAGVATASNVTCV